MSTHADTTAQPRPGRRVAEQARRQGIAPPTLIRHIRRGRRLSDGTVVRCPATLMPGGYRVRDEDADAFYASLTADRLGESAPWSAIRTPAQARREHAAADAALTAGGW